MILCPPRVSQLSCYPLEPRFKQCVDRIREPLVFEMQASSQKSCLRSMIRTTFNTNNWEVALIFCIPFHPIRVVIKLNCLPDNFVDTRNLKGSLEQIKIKLKIIIYDLTSTSCVYFDVL